LEKEDQGETAAIVFSYIEDASKQVGNKLFSVSTEDKKKSK